MRSPFCVSLYIYIYIYIVACYATEDAVRIVNLFYSRLTVRNYNYFYAVTHLHNLKSFHANIPFYVFGASGIHLETADR
jgi:hypothetical protein